MQGRWRQILFVLFDLAALTAVIVLRLQVWPRGAPEAPVVGLEAIPDWWWSLGSVADLSLYGPDAGDWAIQARVHAFGGLPDNRRLPLYPRITGSVARLVDDVVFAGHLVNHAVSLGTALLTYVLGRMTSGRGAALAAALLMACSPALIVDQQLFAVDPTFQLCAVLLMICGVWASTGSAWGIPAAGLALGLCLSTHYLGLLCPFLLVPMLLTRRGGWTWRLAGPPLALGMAAGVFWAQLRGYPPITWKVISVEYAVGIVSSTNRADLQGHGVEGVVHLVLERLPELWARFSADVATLFSPTGPMAGGWVVALCLWGIVGLGLPGEGPWWRRLNPRHVAWFLLLLIPMMGLEAAGAPDRYEHYAWPVLLLGVARGVASLAALLDDGARRIWPRWPREVFTILLCALAAGQAVVASRALIRMRPKEFPGLHERQVGQIVADHFPGRGPIVTWSQEIRFYAGREPCKGFRCDRPSPGDETCPEKLAIECSGFGDLPYVIDERERYGFADAPDLPMDQWALTEGEVVGVVEVPGRRTTVVRIPASKLILPSGRVPGGPRLPDGL